MKTLQFFKRHILTFVMIVSCVLLPNIAKAQLVVSDPALLGNDIYTFIEQNFQHAEQIIELGKQLETAAQNLKVAKENFDMVRKTFSVASAYFKDAKILVDTYDNLQLISDDVDRVKSQVQYYQNGGKLSPSKVYYSMRLAGEIAGRAVDTWTFARDQIMSEDNNLSLHDRMEQLDAINKEFRRYHNIFKKASKDIDEESSTADIAIGAGATYDILTKRVPNGKPTAEEKEDIEEAVEISAREVAEDVSTGETTIKQAKVKRGLFQNNVISIVSYIITILAVLFFGWNFGVYNHGDRQRADVLWKVGAGYIIMMVALSVFDNVFIFNL